MLLSLRSGAHAPCFMLQLSLPKWLGSETHSILKQLLERNVDKRLGSGKSTMFQVKGVQAIKKHPFFRDIDWYLLAQKQLTPPIVPVVQSNTDTTYFAEEFTAMPVGRRSTAATTWRRRSCSRASRSLRRMLLALRTSSRAPHRRQALRPRSPRRSRNRSKKGAWLSLVTTGFSREPRLGEMEERQQRVFWAVRP
jgi:hypothetical protein